MPAPTSEIDPHDCLGATEFVDCGHRAVRAFVDRSLDGGGEDRREQAVALFRSVRDGFRYDPYITSQTREDFRASAVAATASNWCVPKSVLLTAAFRAAGFPAALGFSDVRNHLQSEKLRERMATDVFAWHGYTMVWLEQAAGAATGGWQKVSSAFNIELCERFGTKVLDWDGTGDSLMHAFDTRGNRHMEYVLDRGTYVDLPYDALQATFAELYPSFGDSSAAVADPMFDPPFNP